MNSYWIFICSISLATLVTADRGTQNALLRYKNNLGLRFLMQRAQPSNCDPEKTSCKDDKLNFCAYGVAQITIPCSALFDGSEGYCDCEGMECTKARPICVKPDGDKCPKEGKMPDPADCRKFTYCDGQKKKSFTCPTGMTYDPEKKSCRSDQLCRTVTCNSKKILEYVPFPQSPNYYLFCYFGYGEVMECSQEGYSMQDNKCQFHCKEPGLFKDPKLENHEKGMWHICTYSKTKVLVRQTNYCEKEGNTQLLFDEDKGLCLPKSNGNQGTGNQPSQQVN